MQINISLGQYIENWLINIGVGDTNIVYARNAIILLAIILISALAYFVANRIIVSILASIAKRTKTTWDDVLFERKVFHRLAYLAPAIVVYLMAAPTLADFPVAIAVIQSIAKISMVVVFLLSVNSFLNAIIDIYQSMSMARSKSIKGYIQVVKIVSYVIGLIVIVAILFNKSPLTLLAGLGAFSAIVMLIFKDPIMGFVGSIQLSANDSIRPGDWITMQKYGADGIVLDINLTTVKIQNWDKTITTIPIYSMITDSFQNWRGMEESGARRIKRSVNIDMYSVKFCDEGMLKRFEKVALISEYVKSKERELGAFNEKNKIDSSVVVNGRRQTNIGIFRIYLQEYLKQNDFIRKDMLLLVRQLQPTEHGIPMEVLAFSKEKDTLLYESIQSDIFDHILAVVPEFDLSLFQRPSGSDNRLKR